MKYLVVVVEINPSAQAFDGGAPFLPIPHDNTTAFTVVCLETHLHNSGLACDTKLLVDFVLNGETVRVPAEPSRNVVALHGPIPRNDVLDGRGQHVAIMRQTGRKRRAIVEDVRRLVL